MQLIYIAIAAIGIYYLAKPKKEGSVPEVKKTVSKDVSAPTKIAPGWKAIKIPPQDITMPYDIVVTPSFPTDKIIGEKITGPVSEVTKTASKDVSPLRPKQIDMGYDGWKAIEIPPENIVMPYDTVQPSVRTDEIIGERIEGAVGSVLEKTGLTEVGGVQTRERRTGREI